MEGRKEEKHCINYEACYQVQKGREPEGGHAISGRLAICTISRGEAQSHPTHLNDVRCGPRGRNESNIPLPIFFPGCNLTAIPACLIRRPGDRKDDADAAPAPEAPRPARHAVQQERGVGRQLLPAAAAALPAGAALPLPQAQRHHALLRAGGRRHVRRGAYGTRASALPNGYGNNGNMSGLQGIPPSFPLSRPRP